MCESKSSRLVAAVLVGTVLLCFTTPPAAAVKFPVVGECSGMEDYANAHAIPVIRPPTQSHHRYFYRPWSNTGIGHTFEVYNLALKLALENNLTMVHTPLETGHGPYKIEPELYLGLGRGEVQPQDLAKVPGGVKVLEFPTAEMNFKSHRDLSHRLMAQYAREHGESNVVFKIPDAGKNADQDSDFAVSGAWFRAKFEAARRRGVAKKARFSLLFDPRAVNIAVHIRRGDALLLSHKPATDAYYITVVNALLERFASRYGGRVPVHVHIFSDGSKSRSNGAVRYIDEQGRDSEIVSKIHCDQCAKMHVGIDAMETFHHLVLSDIAVSAISMFTNTAALVSRNIRFLCDQNRSKGSIPNVIVAAESSGAVSPDQWTRFDRLWTAYSQCMGARRGWQLDAAAQPQPQPQNAKPADAEPERDDL